MRKSNILLTKITKKNLPKDLLVLPSDLNFIVDCSQNVLDSGKARETM